MKQVNFKELDVEVGIDEFQPHDIRKEIGNALHRSSESVPMSELARTIYYSDGLVSISDEDFSLMMTLLQPALKRFVFDAIIRSSEKNKEMEE